MRPLPLVDECKATSFSDEAKIKLTRLKTKHDLMDGIYWEEVREQFEKEMQTKAENSGLGMRNGWQVVTLPPDFFEEQRPSQVTLVGIGLPPGLMEALAMHRD
jgi:hypothetical protein